MADKPQSNYDSPWKKALDTFLKDFMDLFFTEIHDDIDWSLGYQALDKELLKVTPKAEIGNRYADKLIKVWLKDGDSTWLLIHIEVQSDKDPGFATRMYIYNNRLFELYQKDVISIAVLADDTKNWRPIKYSYSYKNFKKYMEFPIVKLLDYQSRWEELEKDSNPFAFMVMVSLKSKATKNDSQERLHWKKLLVKGLYQRGYTKEIIRLLLLFLDWIMVLPKQKEIVFTEYVNHLEKERKMEYVTTWERDGIKKGMRKGLQQGRQQGLQQGLVQNARESVIEVLKARFETVIPQLGDKFNKLCFSLHSIQDLVVLKQLLLKASTVSSLEEFEEIEELKQIWLTQEQLALIRGLHSSIISILQTKFGEVPKTIDDSIRGIAQEKQLRRLIEQAVTIESLQQFELILEDSEEDIS